VANNDQVSYLHQYGYLFFLHHKYFSSHKGDKLEQLTYRPYFSAISTYYTGQNIAVSIATRCGLDGSGIEFRWGDIVQTGLGAHPASCTIDTASVFRL